MFVAKGRDGMTDIWGLVWKPTRFDPSKKYPVIEYIYAGPHGTHTPKSFSVASGMQAQAELGFIVVQMDGMGTSNRSKAFQDVAWQNIKDAGFPDRILWHQAFAAKNPWYDITRVGIYGGSAGGQNSMGALLFHPEFYKVAVSYAGCHDNRMDKIWWNEQWMGWPIGPQYSASSNVDHAHLLQGKLLLMVGELDTNVDPSSTLQVVNALIKANKNFDLLIYPGRGPQRRPRRRVRGLRRAQAIRLLRAAPAWPEPARMERARRNDDDSDAKPAIMANPPEGGHHLMKEWWCPAVAGLSTSRCLQAAAQKPSEPQPIVAVTRPVGSWQGRGTATVGDIPSETGRFRSSGRPRTNPRPARAHSS